MATTKLVHFGLVLILPVDLSCFLSDWLFLLLLTVSCQSCFADMASLTLHLESLSLTQTHAPHTQNWTDV